MVPSHNNIKTKNVKLNGGTGMKYNRAYKLDRSLLLDERGDKLHFVTDNDLDKFNSLRNTAPFAVLYFIRERRRYADSYEHEPKTIDNLDSIVTGPFAEEPNTKNTVITKYIKEESLPNKFESVYKTTLRMNNAWIDEYFDKSRLDKAIDGLISKLMCASTTPELKTERGSPLSLSINGSNVHIDAYGSRAYFPLLIEILSDKKDQNIVREADFMRIAQNAGFIIDNNRIMGGQEQGIKYTEKGSKEPTYLF